MTRAKIVALFASAMLLISGCTSGTQASSDGIVYTNGKEPKNPLIPFDTNEIGGGKILDLIFSGLVYYGDDGSVRNEVAQDISTSDHKTYTVTLKDGWTFTDGTPVKAENFVKAWKTGAKDAATGSSNYAMIAGASDQGTGNLTGLHVVNDKTFTITLKAPDITFPTRLGHQSFYPLPDAAYGSDGHVTRDFGEHPIGNGMYKLNGPGAWEHNIHISLLKNPEYKGERVPQNNGITVKFYTDATTAYNDLLAENIDVLDSVDNTNLGKFHNEFQGRAVSQPVAWIQHLVIREDFDHFGQDEEGRLRRAAISQAIDRKQIVSKIFYDTVTPAKDFTAPTLPGYDPDIPGNDVLTYNPTKAKADWDKAQQISKFDGELRIAFDKEGGHEAWVKAVCNQLKDTLGIRAVPEPFPQFGSMLKGVEDGTVTSGFRLAYQAGWPLQSNLIENLFMTGATANYAAYSNPKFDELLRQAAEASDDKASQEKVGEAQQVLLADLPAIPLWYNNVNGAWSTRVKNVNFDWHGVAEYWKVTKP